MASTARTIADVLLITGGLNWGAIAVSGGKVNPVDQLTGGNDMLERLIYGAVGAAAVYAIVDEVVRDRGVRKVRKLK
jgi:uncharacterized membrane protein YuzA (DUF378 family)